MATLRTPTVTISRSLLPTLLLLAAATFAPAEQADPDALPVRFKKHIVDTDLPALSVVVMDVDEDGQLDIIAAGGPHGGLSPYSGKIFWYQAPDWRKQPVADLGETSIILHIDVADLGRKSVEDGRRGATDLIVCDGRLEQAWRFRYNPRSQQWQSALVADAVSKVHGSHSGDIDGDGLDDLVMAHRGPKGHPPRIVWFRNPGLSIENTTSAWERFRIDQDEQAIAGGTHYVKLVDLNTDGRLDVLLGSNHPAGWFGRWLQPDDPRQPWDFQRIEGPMVRGTNLDAADLNGDGILDLVATEGHGTGVWLLPGPDYHPQRIDADLQHTHCLALADIDGDERLDLVTGGYGCGRMAVFFNSGGNRFMRGIIDNEQSSYDVRVRDLNDDGLPDIVVAGQRSGNVVWYENLGNKQQ